MPKTISKDEFERLMNAIYENQQVNFDPEIDHSIADKLLVETLEGLGYNLESFKKLRKWYA